MKQRKSPALSLIKHMLSFLHSPIMSSSLSSASEAISIFVSQSQTIKASYTRRSSILQSPGVSTIPSTSCDSWLGFALQTSLWWVMIQPCWQMSGTGWHLSFVMGRSSRSSKSSSRPSPWFGVLHVCGRSNLKGRNISSKMCGLRFHIRCRNLHF